MSQHVLDLLRARRADVQMKASIEIGRLTTAIKVLEELAFGQEPVVGAGNASSTEPTASPEHPPVDVQEESPAQASSEPMPTPVFGRGGWTTSVEGNGVQPEGLPAEGIDDVAEEVSPPSSTPIQAGGDDGVTEKGGEGATSSPAPSASGRVTMKDRVKALHQRNPNLTVTEVAEMLGTTESSIRGQSSMLKISWRSKTAAFKVYRLQDVGTGLYLHMSGQGMTADLQYAWKGTMAQLERMQDTNPLAEPLQPRGVFGA